MFTECIFYVNHWTELCVKREKVWIQIATAQEVTSYSHNFKR